MSSFSESLTFSVARANMVGISLSSLVYGLHATLFIGTVRHWREFTRHRWLMLGYFCLLFAAASVAAALQLRWNSIAFINNYDYPGGPLTWLAQNVRNPMNLAMTTIYLCINWLSDGMLLLRFVVVFGEHKYAILASVLIMVLQIALGSYYIPDIAALGMNLWITTPTAPAIAYLTLTLVLNVVITFLISIRLLLFARQMELDGAYSVDPSRSYHTVGHRILGIAAPYAALALLGIVTCGVNSPLQNALLPLLGQLQAVPALLVTFLAIEKRHRPSPMMSPPRFSSAMHSVHSLDGPDVHFLKRWSSALSLRSHISRPRLTIIPYPDAAKTSDLRSPIVDRPDRSPGSDSRALTLPDSTFSSSSLLSIPDLGRDLYHLQDGHAS